MDYYPYISRLNRSLKIDLMSMNITNRKSFTIIRPNRIQNFRNWVFSLLILLAPSAGLMAQQNLWSTNAAYHIDGKPHNDKHYDSLKKAGKLNGYHVEYNTANGRITPPVPANVTPNPVNPQSINTCDCWITLDSSFSVCQFDGSGGNGGPGLPPDYRNDDWSTVSINLPFNFCFYGTNETSLFINNNGNVSFGLPYSTFTSNPFPDPSFSMIAPFWGDVDTRGGMGIVHYQLTPTHLIVKWDSVGYYNMYTDKYNTFQLILTDGTDPLIPSGNNCSFCYKDMQWTTGDASGGIGGFGGTPATVGANQGNGIDYIQFGRFDQPGTAYTGPYPAGPYEGVSWLDNQSFIFSTCSSTNIPPIVSGLTACDTIFICEGDTTYMNVSFLSPEIGQVTTDTAYADSATVGFTLLGTTFGNTATVSGMFVGDSTNHGYNLLTFSATDNGTPIQTTIVNIMVHVDTFAMPHPILQGDTLICPGTQDTLSLVTPGYDTYLWSNGSTSPYIVVGAAGTYTVQVTYNGCRLSASFNVTVGLSILPLITGPTHYCHQDSVSLSVQNNYLSYLWTNGFTGTTQTVDSGTYTVTVTDQYGCTMTSPPFLVTATDPQVNITGIDSVCFGSTTTLTANPLPNPWTYLWSNSSTANPVTIGAGNWSVTVTDTAGCTDTASYTVISVPLPTPTITGNLNYCPGRNTVLTANPSGLSNYSWSNGTGVITDTVTAGTYTVTVTGTFGCTGTSPAVTVTQWPAPTPDILGAGNFCYGGSATLVVDSPYVSYLWSDGVTTGVNTVDSTGLYTVTVTDANGCTGTSPAVNTTAYPIPVAAFTSIPNDSIYADSVAVMFFNQSTVSSGTIASWTWDFGDGSTDTSCTALPCNPSHMYAETGHYLVVLTIVTSNGCVDTVYHYIDVLTTPVYAPNVFSPGPNGHNDLLHFKYLEFHPNSRLVIYNRWGTKLYESADYKQDWDGGNYSDGVYYYILYVSNGPVMYGFVTLIRDK